MAVAGHSSLAAAEAVAAEIKAKGRCALAAQCNVAAAADVEKFVSQV